MGRLLHILIPALLAILLGACESTSPAPEVARGLMNVELVQGNAEAHDQIKNVRIITFNNASTYPTLDINQSLPVTGANQNSTVFTVAVETSLNDDKMVILVVNEPADKTMLLNAVADPHGFADILFSMNTVFTANHAAPAASGLPMSGVKRGVVVTKSNSTLATAADVKMTVERSVARVDVYLKKSTGLDYARVTPISEITLSRSHGEGYLITGTRYDETRYQPEAWKNFGNMLTVPNPSLAVSWKSTTGTTDLGNDKVLFCSFYTPERTCSQAADADKLMLKVANIATAFGDKTAEMALTLFTLQTGGGPDVISEIRRNNVYAITGTVQETRILFNECIVEPWTTAGVGVIIDPQFYLSVEKDVVSLGAQNSWTTVQTETDYDLVDRGYPPGIVLAPQVNYYDQSGTPVTSAATGGDKYGWLSASLSGAHGDLSRLLNLLVTNALSANNTDCYAEVKLQAGNLTKIIKVIRKA